VQVWDHAVLTTEKRTPLSTQALVMGALSSLVHSWLPRALMVQRSASLAGSISGYSEQERFDVRAPVIAAAAAAAAATGTGTVVINATTAAAVAK
jgi:hypothetical protein